MTLDPRKSPVLFTSLCAFLALAAVGALDVWPGPGYYRDYPLWDPLSGFVREIIEELKSDDADLWSVLQDYRDSLARCATVLLLGGLFGYRLHRRLWGRKRPVSR